MLIIVNHMTHTFYTVEETATLLKVSKMTVYRHIKSGKMLAYKIGKDYRISEQDFEAYLKSTKVNNIPL